MEAVEHGHCGGSRRGLQGCLRGWKRLNTDTEEDLIEVFKVRHGWKRLNTVTVEDFVEIFKVSVVDGNG